MSRNIAHRSTYKSTVDKTVSGRDPRAGRARSPKSERVLATTAGEVNAQLEEPEEAPGSEEKTEGDEQKVEIADEDWQGRICGTPERQVGQSEEAEDLKSAPSPTMPSPAEVEEHKITHTPYRSWCRECVMGRGCGRHHCRRTDRARDVPRIGIDYWYLTAHGFQKRKELEYPETPEGEKAVEEARTKGILTKCLVLRCHETKVVFAHVVPCKGIDEDRYVVDVVTSDVAWLGHARLILKSDNEVSLLKLVKQSLESIKCNVDGIQTASSEQSVAYDSQSNGGTECAVRMVRGLFRTLKLCTERRIGQEIMPGHPLVSWLVEHAAMVITIKSMGEDGKTAWARARGRGFGQRMLGFGESVMWKLPLKGPQHDEKGNMAPRMTPGTFVGYHKGSNSCRVITEEGHLVHTREPMRRPLPDRWNAEILKGISVTPWSSRRPTTASKAQLGDDVQTYPKPEHDVPSNPRRLKITMKTLKECGTTEGCDQCRHVTAFGEAKPGLAHSEICRKRILEEMTKTEQGMARINRHENRIDRAIAERIEQADQAINARPDELEVQRSQVDQAVEVQRSQVDQAVQEGEDSADSDATPCAMDEDQVGNVRKSTSPSSRKKSTGCNGTDTAGELVKKLRAEGKIKDANLKTEEDEYLNLIMNLGADPRSYRREKKRAFRNIVSEIYSPPRVTDMIRKVANGKLLPGFALDLTTVDPDDGQPWDFDLKVKREKALKLIREQKPMFVIGSPMCTAWCTWQALNAQKRPRHVVQREGEKARLHLEFAASIYREQVEGGRFFLHEQPKSAGSWSETCIKELMELPGVSRVDADQCQYGQEVRYGQYKGQPVCKPTGFMSNAPKILEKLKKKCSGISGGCSRAKGGRHVLCSGRTARDAAKYTKDLCKAIIKGMVAEMRSRGIVRDGEVGMHAVCDEACEENPANGPEQGYSGKYRDDITGQVLKDSLVQEARQKELKYFHDKGVWVKRPKSEARKRTGKGAISVRWVDVNKGDEHNPRYRSRLVARQIKAHDRSGASFFAPTPPLEALRVVLSLAATTVDGWKPCYDPDSENRTQISLMDISRAYFNAKVDKDAETYVQLPTEDDDCENMCAKLLRHMYGTRAAADGWQEEYSTFLVESLQFTQGLSCPCVFQHKECGIIVNVHGDDFTAVGPKSALDWFEEKMEEHYELTKQPRLGPGADDGKEGVILNRVVRWTESGIEYEADPRQAEKLVAECGMDGVNPVGTPGVRVAFKETEDDKELPARLHTAFRGAAARANYLAADRLDCQFSAKEICRWMSRPTESSWAALKRLCRYLVGLPRLVWLYRWQEVSTMDVYTDTDWAGCPRTRKSTSGGRVLLGSHTL